MRFDTLNCLNSLANIQDDSLYFRYFLCFSTIILIIFFIGISDRFFISKTSIYEFPILILFLFFGGLFALSLHTFIDIFLGLEIVTLASYVLITFERQNRFSTYAGIQYFILGSLPSARLLIAFGLFYIQGGSVALQDLDILFNTVVSSSELIQVNDLPYIFNNVGDAITDSKCDAN
jgi:NADH:ubiquinone oxidoreductase subunit 2 (subunit N)